MILCATSKRTNLKIVFFLVLLSFLLTIMSFNIYASTTVYVTKTGECYHNAGCNSLRSSSITMSLEEAINSGHRACEKCHAPSSSTVASTQTSVAAASVPTTTVPTLSTQSIPTFTKAQLIMFKSLTNPAINTKPAILARPNDGIFKYADFATYNSYADKNGLKGTKIYNASTVQYILPMDNRIEKGMSMVGVGIVLLDADGYQWVANVAINSNRYNDFVAYMTNKTAFFYGNYVGYSDVLGMPSFDLISVKEVNGVMTSMDSFLL